MRKGCIRMHTFVHHKTSLSNAPLAQICASASRKPADQLNRFRWVLCSPAEIPTLTALHIQRSPQAKEDVRRECGIGVMISEEHVVSKSPTGRRTAEYWETCSANACAVCRIGRVLGTCGCHSRCEDVKGKLFTENVWGSFRAIGQGSWPKETYVITTAHNKPASP